MAEKNSRKRRKTNIEKELEKAGVEYKIIEVDPEAVAKKIEEAAQKGLGIFPGRPGKGPCGGCDLVLGPRFRR